MFAQTDATLVCIEFLQNRLAEGGTLLPQRYKRLVIRAQISMRFEEFDFTYCNKTRFAGLENDLPNCYCNALLQVCCLLLHFWITSSS
jgi:PAB-dependent poly(A)-specific ribonuclease subunit 2